MRFRRTQLVFLAVAAVLLMGVSGCERGEKMSQEERAEQASAQLRELVDELVPLVGDDPEVRQDEYTECNPDRNDSAVYPVYTVRVQAPEGALARLQEEILDRYEAEGWAIRRDRTGVRFGKDGFILIATANAEGKAGRATVGGSGPCIK
jgi:hypothetical protein